MYDIPENQQDYRQKWIEAERDLLLLGKDFPIIFPNQETSEIIKKDDDIILEPCSAAQMAN